MSEIAKHKGREAALQRSGVNAADEILRAWFVCEVLPLERVLMQFLRNNWRNESEVEDLCHDVYLRAYEAAADCGTPESTKPFIFAIARNLLIDRVRKGQVVPIEAMADLEKIEMAGDAPSAERNAIAVQELRLLQKALDALPPRCREVVILKRLHGLTRGQIAVRLGIAESTVAEHLANGMRQLANALFRSPAGDQS